MIEYIKSYWHLRQDNRAVTALEYALVGGLVAVVIITAVTTLGTNMNNIFTTLGTKVGSA
jgi:pilus assembly protein Flp/PilA